MDRNETGLHAAAVVLESPSARRAWIEISSIGEIVPMPSGSPSARRAWIEISSSVFWWAVMAVALREEGVDRNLICDLVGVAVDQVALREEGVDRNFTSSYLVAPLVESPSARRAWIEMCHRAHQ